VSVSLFFLIIKSNV